MSIYNLIAFNAATNQMKQNQADAANLEAKRTQTAQAQEDLQNSKTLDLAKAKQAHVEGQISDVTSDAITDAMNEKYKAKSDVLDAQSDIQDNLKLKMQDQQQQLQQTAQAHAQNITPDDHAQLGAMLQSIQGGNGALSAPMGPSGGPAATPMAAAVPSNPNTPSIIPQSVAPQMAKNIGGGGLNLAGITPPPTTAGAGQGLDAQTRVQGVQQPTQAPAQEAPTAPISPNVAPAGSMPTVNSQQPAQPTATSDQAVNQPPSSSPMQDAANTIGKAWNMPAGAMWINPSSGKPEMNPIYMQKMEALNRAQAAYDVNHPYAEVKNQEGLEKQYADRLDKGFSNRSGGLGLMDSKVNQATLAQQLLDQYYDKNTGEYHVPTAQYTDLAISLATLLAPGSQASDSKVDAIKQKTAQGDWNGLLQYVTGSPKDATTPAMIQNLADSIKREGVQAEKQRNIYLTTLRNQAPSDLDPKKREYLEESSMYPSFQDYLKVSPSQQKQQQASSVPANRPAGATHYSPSTGQFYDAQGNVVK